MGCGTKSMSASPGDLKIDKADNHIGANSAPLDGSTWVSATTPQELAPTPRPSLDTQERKCRRLSRTRGRWNIERCERGQRTLAGARLRVHGRAGDGGITLSMSKTNSDAMPLPGRTLRCTPTGMARHTAQSARCARKDDREQAPRLRAPPLPRRARYLRLRGRPRIGGCRRWTAAGPWGRGGRAGAGDGGPPAAHPHPGLPHDAGAQTTRRPTPPHRATSPSPDLTLSRDLTSACELLCPHASSGRVATACRGPWAEVAAADLEAEGPEQQRGRGPTNARGSSPPSSWAALSTRSPRRRGCVRAKHGGSPRLASLAPASPKWPLRPVCEAYMPQVAGGPSAGGYVQACSSL